MEVYKLTVEVLLVPSKKNMGNRLTRVLQWWFTAMKPLIGAIYMDELVVDQIMSIHRNSGHLGVWSTTYFVRRICPATTKVAIKLAIQTCEACQSIHPAPVHLEKGTLVVNGNWQRLGMDITLWCLPFPNTQRLWSVVFLNLEATGVTRLGKHDSPAGDCFF